MRHLAIATALLATTLLSAPPALAGDAGSLGLSVGGMLLLTVGGGVVTSVLLGQAVTDDERVHPALRNMGFGFGGVNAHLVIEEYVENTASCECLKKSGVDYAQGWAIERPSELES